MSLVCYCVGGLGNRLRPLASCYEYANQNNIKLLVHWDDQDLRCQCHIKDLFDIDIELISEEQLATMKDVTIFANSTGIDLDRRINNRTAIPQLEQKYGLSGSTLKKYTTQNAILYSCFFQGVQGEKDFIRNLRPTQSIQAIIDSEIERLKIDKDTIGVHARGSDFFPDQTNYIAQIKKLNTKRIFLCSDEEAMEATVRSKLDIDVVTRNKVFVSKKDANKSWAQNTLVTKEAAIDSVVDMYLLSKTNLVIYDRRSTFAELARLL